MARNAIKSDFRSSKMAAGSHFVKEKSCVLIWNGEKCDRKWFSVIQNGRRQPFYKKKSCVLIWNGEKCHRKWFSVIQNGKNWVLIWNGEKCDRTWFSVISKMDAGSHFNKKKSCLLIWNGEKCHRKWFSAGNHFVNKWSEMARNAIGHPKWPPTAILWEQNQSCVLLWNGDKCDWNLFSVIQNGGGGASQWPFGEYTPCKPFGDIHSICPWANSGGVRGIPVQRSCLFLIFRSLFSLQIISRSLFWEHSPFTVLSNNYSLFTVLR